MKSRQGFQSQLGVETEDCRHPEALGKSVSIQNEANIT